jgi:glycosyltransferase involved in cell wall biosynthesis
VVVYGRDTIVRARAVQRDGIEVRSTPGVPSKSLSTLTFGHSACRDAARSHVDAALILNVANGYFLKQLEAAGVRTCVNVDGVEWRRDKWGTLARRVFLGGARATVAHADELIFDSEALREIWSAKFGRSGRFIPYGATVRCGLGTEALERQGLPQSGYLLAVCRIVPENNLGLLLDALEFLSPDVPVVVAGDSNYDHPTVRRLRQLASTGRVTWLGHVEDQDLLDELWQNAGVYFHGHSVGGTNPALLQALALGAPTLALDTEFNREVVGASGQLVSKDPELLAQEIEKILRNPDLADELRAHGRSVVETRYTWPGVCEAYLALLEELAAGRDAGESGPASAA